MNNTDKETIQFDCSRGCSISRDSETGELEYLYKSGCCKLETYNWLRGVNQEQFENLFEVRFKNTRKDIYINTSGQSIAIGDFVVVEANNGHDLGIVTLEGPIVGRQMRNKNIPADKEFKKIYRKANPVDIEKWQEAVEREQATMIKSRKIAAEMGLDMKIGDVEFQGDGTKAIFYYIADGRVDFRQLIKVFAEEFRIRIEMRQIGARQEAGLIGGLGVCGRELCCANHITDFQSITTGSARCQDLALNPQKLAGQCGKLKCCLNYEVQSYLDAKSRIPRVTGPLEFEDGKAYLVKTDVLREKMYFAYDKESSIAGIFELSAAQVFEIIRMNKAGRRPETLKETLPHEQGPQFISAVGDDSISRFDDSDKNRKKNRSNRRRNNKRNNKDGQKQTQRQAQKPNQKPKQAQRQNQNQRPQEGRQKPENNAEGRGNKNNRWRKNNNRNKKSQNGSKKD